MKNFLARPETTRKAIRACENRIDEHDRQQPDHRSIRILYRVLDSKQPDFETLSQYKNQQQLIKAECA